MHGVFLFSEYLPTAKKAKSEGLIGAAITLIKTYPGPGFGIGIDLTTSLLAAYKTTAFIVFSAYINFIKSYIFNHLIKAKPVCKNNLLIIK